MAAFVGRRPIGTIVGSVSVLAMGTGRHVHRAALAAAHVGFDGFRGLNAARVAGRIAIAVGGCRVVFLDMAAVGQQNGAEIGRRLRAVDRTLEAVPHQGLGYSRYG